MCACALLTACFAKRARESWLFVAVGPATFLCAVMPTDGCFGFSVLVAGLPVPEYTKDGETYVESNLWTPASYQMSIREFAYGEVEEQKWPVTPYTIRVCTEPHCPLSWFDVYVDGVKVGWEVCGGAPRTEW